MIMRRVIRGLFAGPVMLLSIIGLLCSSCLETIDLNTGESILNVYCILNDGPTQELELSVISPESKEAQPVGKGIGVTISLFDEGNPVGQFTRVSDMKWALDFVPQSCHTYKIEINYPEKPLITAQTRFPSSANFNTAIVTHLSADNIQTVGFELNSEEDQVLWCYYEDYAGNISQNYVVTDHPGLDRRGETSVPFVDDGSGHWGFDFANNVYSSIFYGRPAFLHDRVARIVHPANFNRPIDDKKITVSHILPSETETSLPEYILETGTTPMFGMTEAKIDGLISYFRLVINSVSDEYDAYLADFFYSDHDSNDFASLIYKKNHYSNIMNGTGIFGASHVFRANFINRGAMAYGW